MGLIYLPPKRQIVKPRRKARSATESAAPWAWRKISHAILPTNARPVDVVTGTFVNPAAAVPTFGVGRDGRSMRFVDASLDAWYLPFQADFAPSDFSVTLKFNPSVVSGTQTLWGSVVDFTWTEVSVGSSGQISCVVRSQDNSAIQVSTAGGKVVAGGGPYTVTFRVQKAQGLAEIWFGDDPVVSATGSTDTAFVSFSTTLPSLGARNLRGSLDQGYAGDISLAVWCSDGALSSEEIGVLHADPFAPFRPAERRIIVAASGGGTVAPWLAARSNILLQPGRA